MPGEQNIMRAAHRYEVILKVAKGMLTMEEAAACMGLTSRHLRRLKRAAKEKGLKGLIRQGGRLPWNAVSDEEKCKVIALRKKYYREFNVAHFRDILKIRHGIDRSHEFYRQLLLKEKLCAPRVLKRRTRKHRRRFEAPRAGVLVQRDTSIHLWVPGAKKAWKLILDLDDHSRKITGAIFSERDDVLSNMLVSWETISTHGIPFAYYTDNNPIYNPKNKKPRSGMYQLYRMQHGEVKETISQFKRALKELGIECIHSTPYQPQGKGKIERIFRFMQDRLLNEMALAKVRTISQANKYLKKWVEWYNSCHLHSSTKQIPNERYLAGNTFRPLPGDSDLDQIFCLKYERTVKADNTFQHEGRTYQIKRNEYRIGYAKAKVEVRIHLSGKMRVLYKNREIGVYNYNPPKSLTLPSGEDIFALE